MKLKIAILSQIWPETIERLSAAHDCLVVFNPESAEKRRMLADAEVVVMRSPVVLDSATLNLAPRLRLIIRAGMGVDGIDLTFARDRNVAVVLAPLSAESVAEHVLGLILALAHRIPYHDRALRVGRWLKHEAFGWDLRGRTLGLVGFGRVGRRTAELATAFGMTIVASDPSPEKPQKQAAAVRLGLRFLTLEDLLRASDVVSIQTPLTPETRGMIDEDRVALMKPGAVLINVGRGGVVCEAALNSALRSGRLAGAALDVFEREPPHDSPLLQLDNFVGTPHAAAQTLDAQREIGETLERIVGSFQHGESLDRWGTCL